MTVYRYSKKYTIGIVLFFSIGAAMGIQMMLAGRIEGGLLLAISVVLMIIFGSVRARFITTERGLKKVVFRKEEACEWEWVSEITTEKSTTTGGYYTVVHWGLISGGESEHCSSNGPREYGGNMVITSHVAGYQRLLKEIVDRSVNVKIDETTSKLVGR